MYRFALISSSLLLLVLPVCASEPGEPLDCSDWTFNLPGFSCIVQIEDLSERWWQGYGSNLAVDNLGRPLQIKFEFIEGFIQPYLTLGRTSIIRLDATGNEEIVASIEDRETLGAKDQVRPLTFWDWNIARGESDDTWSLEPFWFDAVNGRLMLPVQRYCTSCDNAYPNHYALMVIQGFTPLLEIFHSYEPTTSTIGLRVPKMPEGFEGADIFDTYYGTLAAVGDWSQAQPLACQWPLTFVPIQPGDYFTLPDPLPTPSPGHGYYYVTAVNYQGQMRYGRKTMNRVLSGRDPSLLPNCD